MIDITDTMKQVTLIASRHNMKIKQRRLWYVRAAIAARLLRLTAWVAGWSFEETTPKTKRLTRRTDRRHSARTGKEH